MVTKDLQIYKDCFQLIDVVIRSQNGIPRVLRYTIGQRMIDASFAMMQHVIRANRRLRDRAEECERVIEQIEAVGVAYRILSKRKYLSVKHDARISCLLASIGKQAAGWQRSSRPAPRNENAQGKH